MNKHKEGYYDTLNQCSQGWHDGQHKVLPWWEYFLGVTLLSAYREFERRVGLITTSKGAKTAMIFDAIRNINGEFTISDIHGQCPMVGIDLIRRVLGQERKTGRLECLGRGPEARWRKTKIV